MLRCNMNKISSGRLRREGAGCLLRWAQCLARFADALVRAFAFLITHPTHYSGSRIFSHCFGAILFALVALTF